MLIQSSASRALNSQMIIDILIKMQLQLQQLFEFLYCDDVCMFLYNRFLRMSFFCKPHALFMSH